MTERLDWLDGLAWADGSDIPAREILGTLASLDDPGPPTVLAIDARVAVLSFYRRWRLVRIRVRLADTADGTGPSRETAPPDVFVLWRDGRPGRLLDGSSDPIHAINEDEGLQLEPDQAADYVRFFFFAVRADEGEPFILFEAAPAKVPAKLRPAAQEARPLAPQGTDDQGRLLFDAVVIFRNTIFSSRLALPRDGQLTMVDDDVLTDDISDVLFRRPPPLGLSPNLQAFLAGPRPRPIRSRVGGPPRRRTVRPSPPTSSRPTIVEMVELLLERALRDRAHDRLLEYFNATLPSANELQRFASLMTSSSPVVVVESTIPFVEETIVAIVNDVAGPAIQLNLCRASVGFDPSGREAIEGYLLPPSGPAAVLIPLQVYGRVLQVERLAFDIAARDLAAIITVERFPDVPESLRRHTDLVLRLPELDAASFEVLFERVMGASVPPGWQAGGDGWVKHLLHTDFEHPRRMQLAPAEAFEFVRSNVTERLSAVDPVQGLGLGQLHGLGEARQFAEDLIADIHAAMVGQLPWSQVDRGALLVGAPGTGKTTLARAIAKECGVKFIQGSAATWMAEGGSLGPHIQAIRRTFQEARDYAPSILFIDEIDSLGSREQFSGDNNSIYQTDVINAVLEQMQGLDPAAPVFFIAATNHEAAVDPALRRSGRLDRVIRIPRPNSESLDQIYRFYLGALGPGIALGSDLDTLALGRLSVGLTGADVERIVRGAARRARKAGRPMCQIDVIDEVTDKPQAAEGGLRLTPADLERTAAHEAGHALAMFLGATAGAEIGFVTIVPRDDGTLGFVAPLPDERVHLTRRDYEDKLDVCLGGRAAEELTYGEDRISSGASSDLQTATAIALQMITKLGLGGGGRLMWSEGPTAADLDLAERTLAESYKRVLGRLNEHRPKLEGLAAVLVARQELPGSEVRTILSGPSPRDS